MKRLWTIYHDEIPGFLRDMADTPALRRLEGVGMHCGCEYTQFPIHRNLIPYDRFVHSVGVALIVWHFTHDEAQCVAGLLHDVAAPAFAHTVDFLRGDHLRQEATEDGTAETIAACPELMSILSARHLSLSSVQDYHIYPIADNDSPRLSADRLEYTFGSGMSYRFCQWQDARPLYDDLVVAPNEDGQPELVFVHPEPALAFAKLSMRNSRVFISDEDRYAMQRLAELLRFALDASILTDADLCTTEHQVIAKLTAHPEAAVRWDEFTHMSHLERSRECPGPGWIQVDAKRRRIDPLILHRGRVSRLYPEYQKSIDALNAQDFTLYLAHSVAHSVRSQLLPRRPSGF